MTKKYAFFVQNIHIFKIISLTYVIWMSILAHKPSATNDVVNTQLGFFVHGINDIILLLLRNTLPGKLQLAFDLINKRNFSFDVHIVTQGSVYRLLAGWTLPQFNSSVFSIFRLVPEKYIQWLHRKDYVQCEYVWSLRLAFAIATYHTHIRVTCTPFHPDQIQTVFAE